MILPSGIVHSLHFAWWHFSHFPWRQILSYSSFL